MLSSGFNVTEAPVRMLVGSLVVVAAGVEAFGVSLAVADGVKPEVRLVAEQVSVGLLWLHVKPAPVRLAILENVYVPGRPLLAV